MLLYNFDLTDNLRIHTADPQFSEFRNSLYSQKKTLLPEISFPLNEIFTRTSENPS